MHFSTVLATLALALGATAVSQGQPGGGVNACCLNKSTIESNGVLTGLLTRGVLKNILGTSDQACAEFHVIENLNILGKDITYLAWLPPWWTNSFAQALPNRVPTASVLRLLLTVMMKWYVQLMSIHKPFSFMLTSFTVPQGIKCLSGRLPLVNGKCREWEYLWLVSVIRIKVIDIGCHAAQIVVNELIFKLLCSYRRENQAWEKEKEEEGEIKAVWPLYALSLNLSKRKKTSKTGNQWKLYKQPTVNSSAVTQKWQHIRLCILQNIAKLIYTVWCSFCWYCWYSI